jgi:hypothetical protein
LDNIPESEELRELPFFGTFIKVVKTGLAMRDRLFARKVLVFLSEVSSAPDDKRSEFVEKISSERGRQRAGEAMLLLLDRLDDMAKPEIIGRIVHSAILRKIDYEMSMKLSAMVDRSYINDLLLLPKVERDTGIDLDKAEALTSVGLLERRIERNIFDRNQDITFYHLNKFGRTLAEILEERAS